MPYLLVNEPPDKNLASHDSLSRKRIGGVGEMPDLVRSHNWAATSLGPIQTWSDALIFSVNMMLSCQFPTVVFWGAEMIQLYNDGYRPLMAEKHPHALGQSARECWKEAWDIIGPQFEATYQKGETIYREDVLVPVTRNGRLQDVYWTYSYSPIFDSHGQIDGILIVCHDVTDEILARHKLGESEERLRIALAAADGVGIWDWDIAKDLVYADAGFAQLYGVDPAAAAAGITIAQFTRNIHPDDVLRVDAAIDKVLKTDCEFYEEYRLLQPDGSIRWVLAVGRCTFGPDGAPMRFPGVTIDITARKATEEALSESQARFDAIYSTTLEYIGLLTPEGIILDCNRASLEFAGSSYHDVIGTHYADGPWFACTPGAPDLIKEAIARAAAGERIRHEVTLTRPSGEVITFDFSLAPVRNANGEVVFLVPEGRDITEVKRTESALLQSEKLAAVGRLASSIAHEINNPLESVTNLIFLARKNAIVPEAQKYLDMADQELRRVAVIANQTLRFHKQASKPRAIHADDLFSTVLGIYEGKLKNSSISIEKKYRAAQPVVCFEGDVRQVLNNLVSNALDAMNTGGRLILRSREATEWSTGRKGLVLTIADNGSGMSPEVASQIFEPFFTTKGIAGTGLGLWVSKEVVDRHNGTLRLRSSRKEAQSGTVFTLFLPFEFETQTK